MMCRLCTQYVERYVGIISKMSAGRLTVFKQFSNADALLRVTQPALLQQYVLLHLSTAPVSCNILTAY